MGPYETSSTNGVINPQAMYDMTNVRYGTTTHGKQIGIKYLIKVL